MTCWRLTKITHIELPWLAANDQHFLIAMLSRHDMARLAQVTADDCTYVFSRSDSAVLVSKIEHASPPSDESIRQPKGPFTKSFDTYVNARWGYKKKVFQT